MSVTQTQMPTWLQAAIETDTGAPVGARNARPRRCGRCQQTTLVGLDDDLCAMTATVDPEPIDAAAELAALLTGRRTYNADLREGRVQLFRRDRWQLRTPPSAARAVLAEHRCGLTLGRPVQVATGPYSGPHDPSGVVDAPPF